MVALCAAYAAGLLSLATLPEILALDGIAAEHEHWHIRRVTASELQTLTGGLGALALILSTLAVWRLGKDWLPASAKPLAQELKSGFAGTLGMAKTLPRSYQITAALTLSALTGLRVYLSLTKPVHAEEIASYEFFVSKGLLAVSTYYPIPNNHILSNAFSSVFYALSPAFWWSMRLPVLLASTTGTVGLWLGLLRWANARVALLAAAGFSWVQLCLHNASAGRGYWLLISLAGLVFFSALELTKARGYQRAAWLGLVGGSIAGCYTVPTFAYVLASALAWLLWHSALERKAALAWRVLGAGVAVGAGCAALYAPVLLVSGARLFGNGFVRARNADVFWAGLPAHVWFTEGMLVGQRTVGALGVALVLLGLGYRRRKTKGLTPDHDATPPAENMHLLQSAAIWFAVVPYAVVVAQRVFPPERVLLYKGFFLFVLAALLLDQHWLRLATTGARRWATAVAALGFLAYAGYQTRYVLYLNRDNAAVVNAYRSGYAWLQTQPPGPVLAPEPLHNLYLRFYAHTQPGAAQRVDLRRRPTRRYTYVVAFPNRRGAFQPNYLFPPAYTNKQLEIFKIPNH